MSYRTVFEAMPTPVPLWGALPIAVCAGALIAGIMLLRNREGGKKRTLQVIALLLIGTQGLLISVFSLQADFAEQRFIREARERRDYSVVGGVVTDFVPMPPGGHAIESFNVSGTHFGYGWGKDDERIFCSGHNKGFIHNGVGARITYKDGKILKVEVQ